MILVTLLAPVAALGLLLWMSVVEDWHERSDNNSNDSQPH